MSNENSPNINDTLAQRGSTYGDFTDNARISESLMDTLRNEEGYKNLRPVHRAALNVITQKMARIVNGDPEYKDNWHDITGYSKLAEDRCTIEELEIDIHSVLGNPSINDDDMWEVTEKIHHKDKTPSYIDHKFPNEEDALSFIELRNKFTEQIEDYNNFKQEIKHD